MNKKSSQKKIEENEIEHLLSFKTINKLKSIYRMNSVDKRKESSAEHSWSCIVLADFLLNKYNLKLDRLRIYELLLYHDLAEIHTGDFPFHPEADRSAKKEQEKRSAKKLTQELPKELAEKYRARFEEFENQETKESKFARAIDVFDAQIHEIDYKSDWKGWTKEFLKNNKRTECFNEFPEIKKDFISLVEYLDSEGYFNQ